MTPQIPGTILVHMRDKVQVKLATGTDSYGEPALADPITVRCRVSHERTLVSTATGDHFETRTVVHMPDVPGLTNVARIVLPDGEERAVAAYARLSWPNGAKHLRVVV